MNKVKYIGVLVAMMLCQSICAQKFSVSTNALGYLNLATFNLEGSYAVARHWSVVAGAKYNPFSFRISGQRVQNKQQAYYVGARFWPWHIYSGWWVAAKAQYQEYNEGGILSKGTEEGDRWGGGFTAGYTYMIHPKVNLEFGAGIWAGGAKYKSYSCAVCGVTLASGRKFFILPSDIIIAVSYVF